MSAAFSAIMITGALVFQRAVFGLDPFTIGGSVVAIGKCKPLV